MLFDFEELHKICCKIKLKVPKTNEQYIREGVILSVVIPIQANQGKTSDNYYVGIGVIKKVSIAPKDPFLSVSLQIDII